MSCSSASYAAGQSCGLGQLAQFKFSLEVLFNLIPDSAAGLGLLNETASLENISLFLPYAISPHTRKCVPQCKSGCRNTVTSLILLVGVVERDGRLYLGCVTFCSLPGHRSAGILTAVFKRAGSMESY